MNTILRTARLALLALPLALAGCELFDEGGHIDLRLSDAPIDGAAEVVVTIEGVDFRNVDGDNERFTFPTPRKIDLLKLSNGVTELLLEDEFLPKGDYDSIRLRLLSDPDSNEDSYVRFEGEVQRIPLYVPQGEEARLRIDSDFTIDSGDRRRMTIDFDVRKSLREPDEDEEPQAYRLLPALRVVEDRRSGTITGRIADSRLVEGCSAAVYVYSGRVAPDDLGSGGSQPLTSSRVFRDGGDAVYTAAFLPEGEYTVAFTCDAADDDPEKADDDVRFITERVTVDARETATQNF